MASELGKILAFSGQLILQLDWSRVFSELRNALAAQSPTRRQRLMLRTVKVAIAEPLLTSALGTPPSVYHLAEATGESVHKIYRLLNSSAGSGSMLTEAFGLQKLILADAGLTKIEHGGLIFPFEKLAGVRYAKARLHGPLVLYRMTRYREPAAASLSAHEVSLAKKFAIKVLPWVASGLKVLEENGQLQMLGEFLRPVGEGVVSLGRMKWGLNWQNDELDRLLSLRWLEDEVPFDLEEVIVASDRVADEVRRIPSAVFHREFLSWIPNALVYPINERESVLWCPRCGDRTTVRPRTGRDILKCRYCSQAYQLEVST